MSWTRSLLRTAQTLLPTAYGPGCTVLCYHLVGAGTASPVDLPAALFRRHMKELSESAEVIRLEEVVEGPRCDSERPQVALTFDDAYQNFRRTTFPILEHLGLPATLFVPVGFVEEEWPSPIASAALPPASWQELAEMVDSGLVSVGSHTWSHRELTSLPLEQVDDELRRSKERLEERLEVAVSSFCYPRARWSARVEARVRRIYELAVVGGGGRFRPGVSDPYRIERISLRVDGPRSLGPLLRARVWLEERLADRARALR